MDENITIKIIDENIWPDVKDLIRTGWNDNHIFLKSDDLLKWHYSGYGANKDNAAIAVYDGNKIIGFRLFVPIEITVADKDRKYNIQSVASTLYYLLEEYRGKKIGLAMQLYMMETYKSFFAIASNLKTSAPMHRKSGAFMIDSMYRYVCPLSKEFNNIRISLEDLPENALFSYRSDVIEPRNITSEELAEIWNHSTRNIQITSLNRTEDFWSWRYLESPVYKYLFFGGKEYGAIIVGRVCNLYNEDQTLRSEKVFRILEFIPMNPDTWTGKDDPEMSLLLSRVVRWAQKIGCCACEFYLSSPVFQRIFYMAGFKEININTGNEAFDCRSYFEPCTVGKRLSNVSLYVKGFEGEFDFNKSYFTLSDSDQDRPNIL